MGEAIRGHARDPALTARRSARRSHASAEAAAGTRRARAATEAGERRPSGERTAASESDEPFALGSWLAKQRQLRGIRLEELAALTRLPVRSLERLEAGVFDGQQDGFVRGFVRTVALAIGLDPHDAVSRLLAEAEARPGRRVPDPRRLAVAAVGAAGVLALGLALFEVARAPADPEPRSPAEAPMRRDAVRALALERGLLAEPPGSAGPPAVLLLEPLPAAEPDPAAEPVAPAAETSPGAADAFGAPGLPAAPAPPD